jgi:hypothetical protein
MRQVLLLAAIYSLVIHQSRKNSKEMMPPVKNTITKAAVLSVKQYKQHNASHSLSYYNSGQANKSILSSIAWDESN